MNFLILGFVYLQCKLFMEIEFEQDYLRDLYIEGKTKGKKYSFQPPVILQYKKSDR